MENIEKLGDIDRIVVSCGNCDEIIKFTLIVGDITCSDCHNEAVIITGTTAQMRTVVYMFCSFEWTCHLQARLEASSGTNVVLEISYDVKPVLKVKTPKNTKVVTKHKERWKGGPQKAGMLNV